MQLLSRFRVQFVLFCSFHLIAETAGFFAPAPGLFPSKRRIYFSHQKKKDNNYRNYRPKILLSSISRISLEESQEPIPFVDIDGQSFIECYADSLAELGGVRYTIGVPCDHSVSLCYYSNSGELIPVELDDKLMDEVFPIVESIVADEFGEELVLQRTPQTLTLVGELEKDDEEEDDDFEDDDEEDEEGDDEEEVEELLSFEHEDKEFKLVRLLDPILLVGKEDEENANRKLLLTPQESMKIMPQLEDMFLDALENEK